MHKRKGVPLVGRRRRKCLGGCEKLFMSDGPYNRIRGVCAAENRTVNKYSKRAERVSERILRKELN